MNFQKFKIHASTAKKIYKLFKSKKIQHAHIVVLSDIISRQSENLQLPNVKWVQTDLIFLYEIKISLRCLKTEDF